MPTLIIPVEIQHREIHAASILALEALRQNWTVYLGQKQQIFPFIKFFPKSFWYLKSIVPGETDNLKKIKKYGHIISTLDIEGLILSNGDFGVHKRYSDLSLSLADRIFFWGKISHYEPVLKCFPSIKSKAFLSGSPVVDAWNIEKNKKITKSNGNQKSILISVNFARADKRLQKIRKEYEAFYSGIKKKSENSIDNYNILELEYELKDKSFEIFKNIIPKIAKEFQSYKIIVRPHPEENKKFWINYLKNYKNIKVNNSKTTSDQLLNCDIFIHFNSTMSIQSNFFNKTTIMYNTIKDIKLNSVISPITQNVSILCDSEIKLFEIIKNHEKIKYEYESDINNYIEINNNENCNGNSEKIMKNLDDYHKGLPLKEDLNDYTNSLNAFLDFLNYHFKYFAMFSIGIASFLLVFLKKKYRRFSWRYVIGKKKWSRLTKQKFTTI